MDANPRLSFTVRGGPITEEEERHVLEQGLKWETSTGELLDVSTDVEDVDSSFMSRSQQHSLILFEESEKIYQVGETDSSITRNSPTQALTKTPLTLPVLYVNTSEEGLNDEEVDENKENVATSDVMPTEDKSGEGLTKQTKFSRSSLPLQNVDLHGSFAEGNKDYDTKNVCRLSFNTGDNNDFEIVPCTQNLSFNESHSNIDVVPCTQNLSFNESQNSIVPCTQNFSLSAIEDSDSQSVDGTEGDVCLIPCTQAGNDESNLDTSSFNVSSVPCSQTSTASKDDLDDTISAMTKLLAMADEQEAKERLEQEAAAIMNAAITEELSLSTTSATSLENVSEENQKVDTTDSSNPNKNGSSTSVKMATTTAIKQTPLKHDRVRLLKGRNLCTPSPPRHYVDSRLIKGGAAKPVPINKIAVAKMAAPAPTLYSSTPKRSPLSNLTPVKKAPTAASVTPKSANANNKRPVLAKVDSGLRQSQSPCLFGLSPVANYIHSKPAPSTFARVQGPAKSGSNTPNPQGPKRHSHSVLKTATYFNTSCTPPKIIANQAKEGKRLQPLQYSGTSKVKAVNGKLESSSPSGLVAHRHTGFRDESGNASFIQTTFIQKRTNTTPLQSRIGILQNQKK